MNLLVPDLATTPRLQQFVSGMTEVLEHTQIEAEILSRGKALLADLVRHRGSMVSSSEAMPSMMKTLRWALG